MRPVRKVLQPEGYIMHPIASIAQSLVRLAFSSRLRQQIFLFDRQNWVLFSRSDGVGVDGWTFVVNLEQFGGKQTKVGLLTRLDGLKKK
jgi:hypothetical protein